MTPSTITTRDRYVGCLVGLAAGDALGTTAEFERRDTYPPLVDIVGGGPFGLEPGQWTDDTSMSLCLAASLLHVGGFDAADQMNRYCNWYRYGYLSSNGSCFDIGTTTMRALDAYLASGDPFAGTTNPRSAGNGCIMRLAPVPMFYRNDLVAVIARSRESSRTTHAAAECLDASGLFGEILARALSGQDKEACLSAPFGAPAAGDGLEAIARGDWRGKTRGAVRGSGYVVQALEAALWCFATTGSYREAVTTAANLGEDTDTTAAICGQLAGAFYGIGDIPQSWRDILTDIDAITQLAVDLYAASDATDPSGSTSADQQ